jgi:hypothetical protein
MSDLLPVERSRLAELEAVIERGLHTFVEVGSALMEVRDGRLYRDDFDAFETYCRERWGMSKTHANRHIDAAAVVGALTPIGVMPATESVARELAPVLRNGGPPAVAEAWEEAVEEYGPTPTAAQVRDVVSKPAAKPKPKPVRRSREIGDVIADHDAAWSEFGSLFSAGKNKAALEAALCAGRALGRVIHTLDGMVERG